MRALCHIDDIESGASKGFTIDDVNLFIVRQGQHVYAYLNQCPHLGIPLEWKDDEFLDIDGRLIQCAMHGALFVINTGDCISGPCTGQALSRITCRIEDNMVMVDLSTAQ